MLNTEKKDMATRCDCHCGPPFDDLLIHKKCNTNASIGTSIGFRHVNNTALDGCTFFMGEPYFRVNAIEIFQITD
jgi:hypothetical protein